MTLDKYNEIVTKRLDYYKKEMSERAFFNMLDLIRLDVQDLLRAETNESLTVLPDPQNILWQSVASFKSNLSTEEFIENFSLKIFFKSGEEKLLKDVIKEEANDT